MWLRFEPAQRGGLRGPADIYVRSRGGYIGEVMFAYHRPTTLVDAISVLKDAGGAVTPLAGGTDLMPRWSSGRLQRPDVLVDLKGVAELRGVSRTNGEISIGACTLMTDIESDPVIRSSAPVLASAASRIACPQIRNRATIGGNLCNASPAADTAVPLILLDAVLELVSADGLRSRKRDLHIADFFRGPGSTALGPCEILSRIRFRPAHEKTYAAWEKFGTRPAMEIAVASVGLAIRMEAGAVSYARVAYGSVAPTPLRGHMVEETLVGNPLSAAVIAQCENAARDEITPIDDLRASGTYRRDVVAVMLRRMLQRAAGS